MRISLVIPVYNEQESLNEFFSRTQQAMSVFQDYELIFVDDGSRDDSWKIISSFGNVNEGNKVIGLKLTRNFGQQTAVFAGLKVARFEYIGIIDADLQDPPELLPAMCELVSSEIDIVYGKRISRDGETWFKRISAHAFYRILKILSSFEIPIDAGDFRVITKRVRDQVILFNEHSLFLRGLFAFTGYKAIPFSYSRMERFDGKSKYNLSKLIRIASDAILTFSEVPFKLFVKLGFILLALAIILSTWAIALALSDVSSPGWLSIFSLVLFLGSLNLCFTGLIGKFVIQALNASRSRPLYFIDKRLN